jgi:hypothetical protein
MPKVKKLKIFNGLFLPQTLDTLVTSKTLDSA